MKGDINVTQCPKSMSRDVLYEAHSLHMGRVDVYYLVWAL